MGITTEERDTNAWDAYREEVGREVHSHVAKLVGKLPRNPLISIVVPVYNPVEDMFVQMLEWIIVLIPFAVFGVVAGVMGRTGAGVFAILAVFLVTVTIGLLIHAVIYYSLLLRFLGRT